MLKIVDIGSVRSSQCPGGRTGGSRQRRGAGGRQLRPRARRAAAVRAPAWRRGVAGDRPGSDRTGTARADRLRAGTRRAGRQRHRGALESGGDTCRAHRRSGCPGVARQTVRVGRRRRHVRRRGSRSRTGCRRTGPRSACAHGSGLAGLWQSPSAAGCRNTASPRAPRARDAPACPRAASAPAAAHRWLNRVPLGSGNRNAGRPALRQKFSGSMPRFLNAASTNGCRIW